MTTHTSITIIGATSETGQFLLSALAELDIHIMLIAKEPGEHSQINQLITRIKPRARVEVEQCAREGCWEGDIIIFAGSPGDISGISEHIKEVVTQKTLVTFQSEAGVIEKLLPYSKIVRAAVEEGGFHLESMHEDALSDVEDLFQSAGLGLQEAYSFTKK